LSGGEVAKRVTRDPEVRRLRGRLKAKDPERKARAREDFEDYQRRQRIAEARRVLAEERRRVLVAAGLDPGEDEAVG
jgi:hypothetical protein